MAFSKESRQQILNRGKGETERHTGAGYDFGHVEAAHLDHDKNSDQYQCADNGILLTPVQHYISHILGEDAAFAYNQGSANLIWARLTEDQKAYIEWLDSQP